jgi:outer membrane receptor protein involved in Fe transport
VRTIYSEAFRAPNFFQSYYGDLVHASSDSLRPETVRSMEASFEQRFGSHRVFFGVFRSWWRDLIEVRYLSFDEAQAAAERGQLPIAVPNIAFTQHQNAANIDSYGFNASLEGSFASHRLQYSVHVTEAYSRRREALAPDELLPVAPRLTAKARLAYELGDPLPTLALAGYVLPPRLSDLGYDAGFQPVPFAPAQLDLRLTATGSVPAVPGLSYQLSVDYLFGTRGPYVMGPVLVALPDNPRAELTPLAPLRGSVGLEYTFGEE